jgi:hypothetical protein
MSSCHSQRRRQYPPPWGGFAVLQARVLALVALRGCRGTDLDDMHRAMGLSHVTDEQLTRAAHELERTGRIRRHVAPARYHDGDRIIRRDVVTWTLQGGGEA